ncbi:hypothetical protein BDP27DRAFT_1334466 [Rhodocollybia butyracea]|uniref:Uncharacterized protein n=1 Tax=Rhodocollybia butyracea TaxID=206335 RepID=A0A9P5PKT8_9AGAR|nr:hypothetical protein BDP27DRAFT_1334466 [Rhodocollybia butyracea]
MDNPAMIMAAQDTLRSIKLTEDDDDVLNEISLNSSNKHLAFSTDLGVVGVVDLSNMSIVRMKQKHASICGCVKFVPDRPRELVSAGYDETFLHFDFLEGTCISKHEISSSQTQTTEGVSLSPPFIMSTAMSSTGILAAGTADGHLWLGLGGQKGLGKDKIKRSKKWNGLSDEEKQVYVKVADGPIVAMSFSAPTTLTASTLMGSIIQWEITLGLDKVNALVSNDTKIAIAGLTKDGKGIIEIWDKSVPAHTSTSV